MKNYETFATTADIGIRCRGRDFAGLYGNAVAGLNALLFGTANEPPAASDCRRFRFRGDSAENVLVNLLAEVLSLAYQKNQRVVAVEFTGADGSSLDVDFLLATIAAAPAVDIKAVTYHKLRVIEKDGLKKASVLFDV
ncbi:MAG TPA: archease [Candidatus Binatia bacterium]|nr:archease [Candidatus Binatia bacterium]